MIKIDDMPRRIAVGRTLDNGYSALQIDCGEWVKRHPQFAEYRIEVKRPDGEMYFADTTFADGVLTWNINAADTAIAGDGEFQVVAIGTDGERKTSSHPIMFVSDIIAGTASETPPEANKAWTDKVIEETRKSAAQAAESAAEAKKTLESIPEDYTELSEEVGKLSEEVDTKLNNYKLSANRLSLENLSVGQALRVDTGETYTNEFTTDMNTSDFCDVLTDNPYGVITAEGISVNTRICFYDSNKKYIIGFEGFTNPVSVPAGAKYARVQIGKNDIYPRINIGTSDVYTPYEKKPVVVPSKVSDLANDERYFSAKEAGKIGTRHVNFIGHSENLLDESKLIDGYYVDYLTGRLNENAGFKATEEYIDISEHAGSVVIATFYESKRIAGSFHRCAFYDANKNYISGVSNGTGTSSDISTCVVSVPENAYYIRCGWTMSYGTYYMIAYGDKADMQYVPYSAIDANPMTLYAEIERLKNGGGQPSKMWEGRAWVSYGDSITAQGNNSGGYQNIVDNMLGFGASYRRGVGGQTYKANTSTFYADADGSYAGRYGSNGLTEAPEGTTTHLGYFASWDRITTMIPESIRESIDLVVLCGGTNDHGSVEDVETDGVIAAGTPVWVANSTADAHWAASEHYAGGDYDISTFAGAIASTVTKMRVWCPNAVVVLATPYPRWDTDAMRQYTNSKGLDFREMCEIQIATAKYMGCPVVDANAMCCVGGVNFASTVSDGVHPNTTGIKLYGKALADGLNTISPKIV